MSAATLGAPDIMTLPDGVDVSERYGLPAGVVLTATHPDQRTPCLKLHQPSTRLWRYPPRTIDAEGLRQILGDAGASGRQVRLTAAADFRVRRVNWLWLDRFPAGALSLIAGPEGVGKSTTAYWIASAITRGTLPGEHLGKPRAVLVCASEDSWEHTIVPRLIAHDADLARVHRVDAVEDGVATGLDLPQDLGGTERAAEEVDAALLILDPLMSRLSSRLDSHKDSDVRRALEPLVSMADRTGMAIVGLIHHNKSGASDPLALVMASKAFTAVARAVHTVVLDPDDESGARRLFGIAKSNLGRLDLPTLAFTITGAKVPTDEGEIAWTGQLAWAGEVTSSIGEVMRRAQVDPDDHTATTEAANWLEDWLTSKGGTDTSKNIKKAAHAEGHAERTLSRARKNLHLEVTSEGFPRATWWSLPDTQKPVTPTSLSVGLTGTTGTTEPTTDSPGGGYVDNYYLTGHSEAVTPVGPVTPDVPDAEDPGVTKPGDPWTTGGDQ